MDTNYELYKVFYHVAVTLDFSEVSRQLLIFQSAVSQSIKVLKKKLNQPLSIRSTRKIRLTPEGETLLRHIESAMNLTKRGENRLPEVHTLNDRQLRVGANDIICRYYLIPYLNRFHKEFLNIHIKVTNQISIECVKLLENGQADFIVANYPNFALAGSMDARIINESHDVFVASRSAFPLKGFGTSLEELLYYPIMMLDRKSITSGLLRQVFQKSQLDLVSEIGLSSNDLLIDLARIGLGIASVPDLCIPQNDEELFILDLEKQLPSCQMMVAYNESLPVPQATKRFTNMLQEADI